MTLCKLNLSNEILCSADRATLYNLFQMKPTRCTLLLSMFSSTFLHVSVNYVSIIRRIYRIYATLVFFTLYGWLSGRLVGMSLIPTKWMILIPTSWMRLIPTSWLRLIPSSWVAVWSAGWDETLIPTSRPDSHPYRVKNTSVA